MSRDNTNHERDWDDDAFRHHAITLARAQGRSPSEVCTSAGLTNDYLTRPHKTGRNIRAIIALARELRVSPAELIPKNDPVPVDSLILRRLAMVAHVAAHLYISLDTERRPTPKEVQRIVAVLTDLIQAHADPAEHRQPNTEE